MKHISTLSFIITALFVISSCSVDINGCIPESLNADNSAALKLKKEGRNALEIFSEEQILHKLLNQFTPVEIRAGSYEYYGITIRLGIAKFASADEAFGVYSGLTSMPRKRWEKNGGEMSYKNPYIAGFKGVYAFWFYSPTHPGNYFEFYETSGEKLLDDLWINRRVKINSRSYIYRLLPDQNRFRESEKYIRAEKASGFDIENAYTAAYQSGRNRALIYIEGFPTEAEAREKFNDHRLSLKNSGFNERQFPVVFVGNPGKGIYVRIKNGFTAVYRYRWLVIVIDSADSLNGAEKFIRNIYLKMQDIKDEIAVK